LAQEMLGYNVSFSHRLARIMANVDALNRLYGPLIAHYLKIARILRDRDVQRRPYAYQVSTFQHLSKAKLSDSVRAVENATSPLNRVFQRNIIERITKRAFINNVTITVIP